MGRITQDDLLQYLYKELPAARAEEVKLQLEADADLAERFNVLAAGRNRLEKIQLLSPDERTLANIFNHAARREAIHQNK